MQSGKWSVSQIYLFDKNYNTETGSEPWRIYDVGDDLSFEVVGTKAVHVAPKVDPKSLHLSKSKIKYGKASKFSVKLKGTNPAYRVTCIWRYWKKPYSMMHKVELTYNKDKKRWEGSVSFPEKSIKKMWLNNISIVDVYGNERYYRAFKKNVVIPSSKAYKYLRKDCKDMILYRK